MAVPMVIIELVLMGAMYLKKRWNMLTITSSVFALIALFILIRQQAAILGEQFLKSMISHHSSVILMCNKASIEDTEIKELCKNIISGQQSEINQMNSILDRLVK